MSASGVGLPPNRAGDLVVEARPAAVRLELRGRLVQFGVALPAGIDTFFEVVVEFAGEGTLRSLAEDDAGLFRRQFVVQRRMYRVLGEMVDGGFLAVDQLAFKLVDNGVFFCFFFGLGQRYSRQGVLHDSYDVCRDL